MRHVYWPLLLDSDVSVAGVRHLVELARCWWCAVLGWPVPALYPAGTARVEGVWAADSVVRLAPIGP